MNSGLATALPFIDDLSAALSDEVSGPLEWLALANGDSDPFDSVIFFGFEGSRRNPSLVAKVPRMPTGVLPLEIEYRSLSSLWFLLGEEADSCLPRPVALLDLHGQPALVLSHVTGQSLIRTLRRSFWTREDRILKLVTEAARSLRLLHEASSILLDRGERPGLDFHARADGFVSLFSSSNEEQAVLAQVTGMAESGSRRALRKVLVQGDFWHGNLIRGRRGLVFLDWQFAHWSVDVSADVYLFLLAAALHAVPHGAESERAAGAARLLRRWNTRVIPTYLSAYGQPDEYALLPLKQGLLAACVEKAVRPALDFGYTHPDDLMWRLLFAELVHWPDESPQPGAFS